MARTVRNEQVINLLYDVSEVERAARNYDDATQRTKERVQKGTRAMLIEAEAQTQATSDQRRATRETTDAALDQEGAARQLATKQARAATHATEVAKQAEREKYRDANDEQKGWDERIRSILRATQPVAAIVPGTARPMSDLAILNTIIGRFNQVGTALIEAADVMIDQAGEPRTLASLGENLGRPAQAMLGQLGNQALALQTSQEAERMTLAAKAWGYGAVQNGMISQALYSPSLAQLAQVSPYVNKGVYSAPMAQSLLAAFAFGNESARTTKWLEQTARATSAEFIRNRGTKVAQSRDADYQKSAEYLKSFGNDLRTPAERRFEPIFQGIMTQEDETRKKAPYFNQVDYLLTEGIVNPEDLHSVARLEGVYRNGLWHQLITAANERLGTGVEFDQARQTSLQKQLLSILRDAQAREAVRTMRAGADHTSTSRETIPVGAFTALNDKTTIRERPASIEGRQRFDPREIIWQNREKLGAEAQRTILEWTPATGTRMPEFLAAGMEGASRLASERLLGIFEPTRGAMGGSSGHRIDTDRMARAMEMFTQGLERFASMGRLPVLGAGRSQIAPVPPALPAKPPPFNSRTNGSGASF